MARSCLVLDDWMFSVSGLKHQVRFAQTQLTNSLESPSSITAATTDPYVQVKNSKLYLSTISRGHLRLFSLTFRLKSSEFPKSTTNSGTLFSTTHLKSEPAQTLVDLNQASDMKSKFGLSTGKSTLLGSL